MAVPALSTYSAATGQPIAGGRWPGGMLSGNVDLSAVMAAGIVGQQLGLSGDVALADVVAAGSMAMSHPAGAVLDLISAASSNTWVRLNATGDNYIDHQAANVDKPLISGGIAVHSSKLLLAWSSVGWDDTRGEITLWGGGHGNTAENGTYQWRASDQLWRLGYYSAAIVDSTSPAYSQTINGPLDTPTSSHTFGGMDYAPTIDRLMICAAADYINGDSAAVRDGSGTFVRYLPMYALDTTQQGQGKVAGATGTNVNRAAVGGVDKVGANAWSARDWGLDTAYSSLVPQLGHHSLTAMCVVQESGVDVAYMTAESGAGVPQSLWRVQLNSRDYHDDVITKVGTQLITTGCASLSSVMAVTHNASRRLAVVAGSTTYPIQGWDLGTAGASNAPFFVPAANLQGTGAAAFMNSLNYVGGPNPQTGPFGSPSLSASLGHSMGFCYDPRRQTIAVVTLLGDVMELTPPASGSLTGVWTCTLLTTAATTPRPPTNQELIDETIATVSYARCVTSIGGKLKWSNYLGGCYIYVTDTYRGSVWAFKPTTWVDPRA